MTTNTLSYPAQLESDLNWYLLRRCDGPHVSAYPKGKDGRRSPAVGADCYEIHVCPVATPRPTEYDTVLGAIEVALRAYAEDRGYQVRRTTRVGWLEEPAADRREPARVYKIADPDWPTKSRAGDVYQRPMVWALIADHGEDKP